MLLYPYRDGELSDQNKFQFQARFANPMAYEATDGGVIDFMFIPPPLVLL